MGERFDLNLLLPAGMSRRQVMKAHGVPGLGTAAWASGAGRALAQSDRSLNYFTWSAWAEPPFVEDSKKKVSIDLKPTFYSSSDEMMAKLRGGGTKLYDMVVPVQNYVHPAARAGVIEALLATLGANVKKRHRELAREAVKGLGEP